MVLLGLATPLAAQMETRPMTHNGYSRPYLVYKPAHLTSPLAVVFMLGGVRSTAASTARDFGWFEMAYSNCFIYVFPEPVATDPRLPLDRKTNVTFWELEGSRTHKLTPPMQQVDDDGYLLAVLHAVVQREHVGRQRVFFAGFSSGSGMVQLFASRHSDEVAGIAAGATPLMHPPAGLAQPVSVLYLHGDDDEHLSGFEVNCPHFATTPHGNWVTWGYLNGCHNQIASKTDWGIEFSWGNCRGGVSVVANFFSGLGHEWPGSLDSNWDLEHRPTDPISFTKLAWRFFDSVGKRE
jgi:poly(3-hydroxybutyrate) depolymerase